MPKKYPYIAVGQKKVFRTSKNLARERAEDKGLRGQRAAKYISSEWRDIAQGLTGPFIKNYEERPGKNRRLQRQAVRRARKELRRRRNN